MLHLKVIFYWTLCISALCCKEQKEIVLMTIPHNEFDPAISVGYIMGKFDPGTHESFEEIPTKYADRSGVFLRKEALVAFVKMWEAAKNDSVRLTIISATRNFQYQKGIWERKWTGKTMLSDGTSATDISDKKERAYKVLLYSAMPGTSRHHWGADIDLNSLKNEWFENGDGLKVYNWLINNAHKYGFCQVYTKKWPLRPHGYEEEKWHWSYLPISKQLTIYAEENLRNDMISGFAGAEVNSEIDVVNEYVLGINPDCR